MPDLSLLCFPARTDGEVEGESRRVHDVGFETDFSSQGSTGLLRCLPTYTVSNEAWPETDSWPLLAQQDHKHGDTPMYNTVQNTTTQVLYWQVIV